MAPSGTKSSKVRTFMKQRLREVAKAVASAFRLRP